MIKISEIIPAREKIKNVLFFIITIFLIGVYLKIIIDQYQYYSWVEFPLGWDSIRYLTGAMMLIDRWSLHDFIPKGTNYLYIIFIAVLGLFFDVKQVVMVMPIVLSIIYAFISSYMVFHYTNSLMCVVLSIFLTLFSMRNAQLLALFHSQLLFFILYLVFNVVLLNNNVKLIKLKPFLILIIVVLSMATHIYSFCFAVIAFIFLYKHYIIYLKNLKKYIIFSSVIIAITLFKYLDLIKNILLITFQFKEIGDPWFGKPQLFDYTWIYNGSLTGLILIIISTFYIAYKYRENLTIYFISVFSILALITPLLSLIFPITLPSSRITLLCQYQIILPIFINVFARRSPEINTNTKIILFSKKIQINFIKKMIPKYIITILLIIVIVFPSYNYFKKSINMYMGPWIKQDTYERLIKTSEIIDEDELENPVLIFYGNTEMVDLFRCYALLALGEHHGYYGKFEDALGLIPPENLTYLSINEHSIAKTFYYGENYGEHIPLSEIRSNDITIIVITPFYYLSIPPSYKSENGITIISVREK